MPATARPHTARRADAARPPRWVLRRLRCHRRIQRSLYREPDRDILPHEHTPPPRHSRNHKTATERTHKTRGIYTYRSEANPYQ